MKKKLNILGRKVPVLAVMMVLLVIGTASAALIVNYATLTGEVTVNNPISVTGDGDATTLDMVGDGEAEFTITNSGSANIIVEVVTTLYLDLPETYTPEEMLTYEVDDVEGITITVNGETLDHTTGVYLPETVTALGIVSLPSGITTVPVTFVTIPGVVAGDYTIQVVVKPPSVA